jgi:hypothetical protein
MKFLATITAASLMVLVSVQSNLAQSKSPSAEFANLTQTILYHDSVFWQAYNVCDVNQMAGYFTDDLEFYHDKNGFISPKSKLEEALRGRLCGNPDWQLRREQIKGTVKVFPMNDYGALITGEHLFYINEKGKNEYLDGYGKFTHLWLFKDNAWRMSRIISYDHGPPPFINKRNEVVLAQSALQRFSGKYNSSRGEVATITFEGNVLNLKMGDFQIVMVPESNTKFFAKDRDLQVGFVVEESKVKKMLIYEKGNVVDELNRL